jgi:hypothetical protein
MSTFDKREEGFEEEVCPRRGQKFRAEARRNQLLGMWVAGSSG